jgi:hypothetical protein
VTPPPHTTCTNTACMQTQDTHTHTHPKNGGNKTNSNNKAKIITCGSSRSTHTLTSTHVHTHSRTRWPLWPQISPQELRQPNRQRRTRSNKQTTQDTQQQTDNAGHAGNRQLRTRSISANAWLTKRVRCTNPSASVCPRSQLAGRPAQLRANTGYSIPFEKTMETAGGLT